MIGKTVSHYRILEKLGGGGMGVVYKAEDTNLRRFVALKFLPEELAHDLQALERFRREARAASALNHPNICTIYEIEEQDGHTFIAMELLEGQTLKHRLEKSKLDTGELLDLAIQLADALDAAHTKGIVHRDIKPANIFLTERAQAKILDFGLAKLEKPLSAGLSSADKMLASQPPERADEHSTSSMGEAHLTSPGTAMGTVAYMSPEQALGEQLDARTDLFSLGVVLYEMAAGQRAYPGTAVAGIFDGILNKVPVPLLTLNPALPAKLQEIIGEAMEKDRSLRYQTAGALRTDLKRLKRDLDLNRTGVTATLPVATAEIRKAHPARGWRGWTAIAGTALVAAGILFGYILSRPAPPPHVVRVVQLTHTDRPKSSMVTDGTRLYFLDSKLGVAESAATGGETVAIPTTLPLGDSGRRDLFDISPDGSQLLIPTYRNDSTPEGLLWTLPILGGPARRLGNLEGHAGAWSPDGTTIAFSTGNEIDLARSDGSAPHRLLVTAGWSDDLSWSPGGKILRFTVTDPQTNNRSIWQASSDGSNLHPLLPGWNSSPNECCGRWTPDGKYFVFQAVRDGTANVWAMREHAGLFRSGRQEPVQLTTGLMNVGDPVPSRDGKKLFVQGWKPRGELVRFDAHSGRFEPYLSGISALGLDFSRDGQWVAYNDASDGTMWRSRVDGTQKLQLVLPPLVAQLPRWSPDGKQLAFFGHLPGELWQIYVIPAAGGSPELVYHDKSNLADPNWSPDGTSLVFGENALSNQGSAIYVLDLKTRKASKLPGSDGLFSPRWSPDGRYIVATTLDSLKFMLYEISSRKWTELVTAKGFVGYPCWSHDARYLYFLGIVEDEEGYFRVQISDRRLERVVSLNGFQAAAGAFGDWSGLAPDESPLFVRDASIQEIYALDWEAP